MSVVRGCWYDGILATSAAAAPTSSCPSATTTASPPRVAFLVGGVVRGFDRERMRKSFLHHVVEPLAPDAKNRAFFFALKPLRKTVKMGRNDFAEIDTQMADLKSGIQTLFPGASLHVSYLPVDREVLKKPPGPLIAPPDMTLHPCNCSCFDLVRESVAGFVSAIRRSYVMMEEREKAQGWKFDLVVFTRPDLLFYKPLAPWCDVRWKGVMSGNEFTTVGQDFMYVLPRRVATALDSIFMGNIATRAGRNRDREKPACFFAATETLGLTLSQRMLPGISFKTSAPGQDAALVRKFEEGDRTCPVRPTHSAPHQEMVGSSSWDRGATPSDAQAARRFRGKQHGRHLHLVTGHGGGRARRERRPA